jgi:MYXO-CTERM domain-containing protein
MNVATVVVIVLLVGLLAVALSTSIRRRRKKRREHYGSLDWPVVRADVEIYVDDKGIVRWRKR